MNREKGKANFHFSMFPKVVVNVSYNPDNNEIHECIILKKTSNKDLRFYQNHFNTRHLKHLEVK